MTIKIAAGDLRQVITIQQNTPGKDTRGGPTEAWTTFKTVRARIEPKTGYERWAANQIYSEATGSIIMRYVPGVTAKMRAVMSAGGANRVFEFLPPLNTEEKNVELVIPFKEVTP